MGGGTGERVDNWLCFVDDDEVDEVVEEDGKGEGREQD